jgi:hypothetical protein
MNTQSENIAELAAALAKAQAEMGGVHKDAANPYFKSSYATLAAVWETVKPSLTKNGLSVVQLPGSDERGYYVQTQLQHSSGQWIRSCTYMKPAKEDPQGIGSLISYARRYALMAMVMACPDDDDGEAAMGRPASKPSTPPQPVKKVEPAPKQEKPAVEAPSAKEEAKKFNGENHKLLFEELIKVDITPDEFIAAYKWHKDERVPEKATSFFKMSDSTASHFLFDGIKQIQSDVTAYRAVGQP